MIRSSDDDTAHETAPTPENAAPAATEETSTRGSMPTATDGNDVSSTVYLIPSELISVTPPPVPSAPPSRPPSPRQPPPLRKASPPPATPPLPPPPPFARRKRPTLPSGEFAPLGTQPEAEDDLSSLARILADAKRRIAYLPKADKAGQARALFECGLLLETLQGDTAAAQTEYQAALRALPGFLPALVALHRLLPRKPLGPTLAHLEEEIRATTHPARRVARLFELGRLEATGGSRLAESACTHLREVLADSPHHPGALRALETALRNHPGATPDPQPLAALAGHLGTMAEEFQSDPALAAWLHVERGRALEVLGQPQAATLAFDAALALDGRIGPVRMAFTEHLAREGHFSRLADAFSDEAGKDVDSPRSARLLYMAARLCADRLDQKSRAIALFERAQATPSAEPFTRKAALLALLDLYRRDTPARIDTLNALLSIAEEAERPYWHRRLADAFLELDAHADVVAHAREALYHTPSDESLRGLVDASLAALSRHDERIELWTDLSGRERTPAHRIPLLLRAADIALRDLGQPDRALASLRAVLGIEPGNAEATYAITRLLAPTSATPDAHAQARLDFLVEAAAAATDPARTVAYLESLARLWEDERADPARAAAVWKEILAIEPHRRGALIGLARTAGRAGDHATVVWALSTEAVDTSDPALAYALHVQAATVALERLDDPAAALDSLEKATAHPHADPAVLRLRFRAHDRAGRPGEALAQLRHLYELRRATGDGFPVLVEIARYTEEKLQRPLDALTAYREAHALAPEDPLPREEARRIHSARGDAAGMADECIRLAAATTVPAIKGELLFQAAEIVLEQLGQLDRALPLYAEARTLLPDEPLLVDRLELAYLRRGLPDERLELLESRAPATPLGRFQVARLRSEGKEPHTAHALFTPLLRDETVGVAALRTLEHALRAAERWDDLAAVLRLQVERFTSLEAQRGSLHELVVLEEFHGALVPPGCARAAKVLSTRDLSDAFPHELTLRQTGLACGAPEALTETVPALHALAKIEESGTAATHLLACGILLDRAAEGDPSLRPLALGCYREATTLWPDSLAAARAGRRLALLLGDRPAFLHACVALGEHELESAVRARRLLDAVHATLATGGRPAVAMDLVCRALATDPDSGRAADGVVSALAHGLSVGTAVEVLRKALADTRVPEQAIKLGAALSYVASHHLHDHTVAIEALRRARRLAPSHAGTLVSLSEVSLSLGLYTEALDAASAALANTQEPTLRARALAALADVHARTPSLRDAARREALEAAQLAEHAPAADGPSMAHIGALLHALGEDEHAGRILVRAVALSDDEHGALEHLLAVSSSEPERTASHLAQVLALAAQHGRPPHPAWMAALGKLESTSLGRPLDGRARLRQAVRDNPGRPESWDALAAAHGDAHADALDDLFDLLPALGASTKAAEEVHHVLGVFARVLDQAGHAASAQACRAIAAFVRDGTRPTAGVSAPRPCTRAALLSLAPDQARVNVLFDAAAALAGSVHKVARGEADARRLDGLTKVPTRGDSRTRACAERVAAAFGDIDVDLYEGARSLRAPAILSGAPPAILLPADFSDRTEADQVAGLARVFALHLLNVPFLDHLPAAEAEGLLFGALRLGSSSYGQGSLAPELLRLADGYKFRLARVVGRKAKRALSDIANEALTLPDAAAGMEHAHAGSLAAAVAVSGDPTAALRAATILPSVGETPVGAALVTDPILRLFLRLLCSERGNTLLAGANAAPK